MRFGKNNFYSACFILFIVNSTFISRCTAPLKKNHDFPYNISEPDKKYVLQHKLTEVSGLSFISDEEVALIEDENGSIFFFNLEKGTVTRKISFAKDGDYEDLKVLGDTAYVLRSDGKLFEVMNIKGDPAGITENKYNTGLTKQNNTEGLCYDNKRKLLLIACKGKASKDGENDSEKYKNKKAIYTFNLQTKKLSDTPLVLINENEVEKAAYGTKTTVIEKFMRFYRREKKSTFQPSGLSINPVTQDIYVLSSVGKLLAVVDSTGKLKHVIKLHPSIFKQPEGIAFDSASNLYITNEGRKGKGNILKFLYLKK